MTEPIRRSRFRSALADDAPLALGTWVKLPAVEVVELIALAGFDFIVIDLEHSPLGTESTFQQIGTALHTGVSPLVRVPSVDGGLVQRVLDAGAEGIVVPHVDSADQAVAAVAAGRFPPLGDRGVGATSRAGAWGALRLDEYLRFGQDEVVIIAQIESAAGVENVDAIASTPGIDALLLGPVDLSVSQQRDLSDPVVIGMIDDVRQSALRAGIPLGNVGAAQAEHIHETLTAGFAFTLLSNDASLFGSSARSAVDNARDVMAHA